MEGFQNSTTMVYADDILKKIGKEKASEKYKVPRCCSRIISNKCSGPDVDISASTSNDAIFSLHPTILCKFQRWFDFYSTQWRATLARWAQVRSCFKSQRSIIHSTLYAHHLSLLCCHKAVTFEQELPSPKGNLLTWFRNVLQRLRVLISHQRQQTPQQIQVVGRMMMDYKNNHFNVGKLLQGSMISVACWSS